MSEYVYCTYSTVHIGSNGILPHLIDFLFGTLQYVPYAVITMEKILALQSGIVPYVLALLPMVKK